MAYTNQAFADAIGCTHSMASRLVNGKRLPSASLLARIADAYDIPIEELTRAREKGPDALGRLLQRRVVRQHA